MLVCLVVGVLCVVDLILYFLVLVGVAWFGGCLVSCVWFGFGLMCLLLRFGLDLRLVVT